LTRTGLLACALFFALDLGDRQRLILAGRPQRLDLVGEPADPRSCSHDRDRGGHT